MKALLVSNDYLPQVGGIQQYSDNIARRLPDVAVFAAAHPDAAACDATLPYPVHRGPARTMLPTPRTQAALEAVIAAEQPDVLLFMTPWPLPVLGTRTRVPFAVCTHGAELVIPARAPGVRALLARTLRAAGCVFAVSAFTGGHARRLLPETPVRLLPTGVPLDRFRPGLDTAEIRARHGLGDEPVVVCVGRLVPRKGQDVLVRAVPTGARLLLVGDGPLRRSLERDAGTNVVFAGQVPWEELPLYYSVGDVFASPVRSRWLGLEQEGFGVIFLEAAACARPVVAGRSGGAPEAVVDGETGLVVDGASVGDVRAAVESLLADPARAIAMGEAGRQFVEERFDWVDIVARLVIDLEAVAERKPLVSDC